MRPRVRHGHWPGKKLDGTETFFVDLRNSLTPVIGGDVTISSTGTAAHCFDYQGNLVNVAANEELLFGARYTAPGWSRYNANDQAINPDTVRGAVVNQAATNVIQYFDSIGNAWWTRNNLAAPGSGTDIASRAASGLTGDATTAVHSISRASTINEDGYFVLAGLFAAGDNDHIYIRSLNLTTFDTSTVWFNLATGAVGTETSTATMLVVDSTITKVNGGYWCSVLMQNIGAQTSCTMVYGSCAADNATTFLGDGATVNTWMCALQAQINIADTVVPVLPILGVEGANSTSADMLIEYDSSLYTTVGSIIGEFFLPDDPIAGLEPQSIFTFQSFDQDTDDSMRVHMHSSGKLQFVMWPGPSVTNGTMIESTNVLTKGTINRFAVGWDKADDGTSAVLSFYLNGVKQTTEFGGFNGYIVPTGTTINRFYLGSRSSNDGSSHHDQFFNRPISFLKKYATRLTDAQLQARSV